MGLLDDAIREHLDLKRRRGADPAEVARAEQEALGPVRRDPAPAEEREQPAVEHEQQRGEPAEAPRADDGPQPELHAEPERPPPPSAREPDPRHDDIVHQPTTEFRVEDHHDDEDEPFADEPTAPKPQDEDVLEETPDFLQETPEHDRLWFEQRPPRDFDFDG